ncbi:hypothetical protein QFC20_006650 [Naganishia adeliensis]|uniref:Uncharacterized protein n=1 Tax=Naganishia adeliensis TaxID=92952 RepID=A0ACC2V8V3_9TREE|nr:hypothetical protein QFC20_006650 [Naganishia adeliensis]
MQSFNSNTFPVVTESRSAPATPCASPVKTSFAPGEQQEFVFSGLLQDGMEEGEIEKSVSNCVNVDTVHSSFFGPLDPLAQAIEGDGPITEFDYNDYLKLAFCSEPLAQYEEKDSLPNYVLGDKTSWLPVFALAIIAEHLIGQHAFGTAASLNTVLIKTLVFDDRKELRFSRTRGQHMQGSQVHQVFLKNL